VEFQLNYVLDKYEPRKVIAALATVPQSLPAAYNDVLARIERRGADRKAVAMKVLSWVIHAHRPLRIEELQEAIAVEDDDTEINEDYLLDPPFIVDVCESLVGYDKGRNVVFTHYTVQEFFQNEGASFLLPISYVAKTCLTYLTFNELDSDMTWENDYVAFPFSIYAAEYWPLHVRAAMETSMDIQINVLKLLIKSNPSLPRPGERPYIFHPYNFSDKGGRGGTWGIIPPPLRWPLEPPLHVVAEHGFSTICKWLLGIEDPCIPQGFPEELKTSLEQFRKTVDVNEKDRGTYGRTALYLASSRGHEMIVESLLNVGADVHCQMSSGDTALHGAVWQGHHNIVRRLLSSGALVNSKGSNGYTALHAATATSHLETIKLLCQNGVDVKARTIHGDTAFGLAWNDGNMDMILWFLTYQDCDEELERVEEMGFPDYVVPSAITLSEFHPIEGDDDVSERRHIILQRVLTSILKTLMRSLAGN
jgi:ankyrin repeat domain-containing protein 50